MIDVNNGHLRFSTAEFAIDRWDLGLEVDGEMLHIQDGTIRIEGHSPLGLTVTFPGRKLCWRIRIRSESGHVILESRILNEGTMPVHLGKVVLLEASRSVRFGASGDDVVVLPWTLGGSIRVFRVTDPAVRRPAKVKVQFYNPARSQAVQVGFLTFQRANTEILFEGEADRGLHSLQAYCDFAGWSLAGGSETPTEILRLATGSEPLKLMADWADTVASQLRPAIRETAPIGFLGCSWADNINGRERYEEATLETLEVINERLAGFGVTYLWTSIVNLEGGIPGNWLAWNREHLPSGPEGFFAKVRARGFTPGLWIGPFYMADTLKGRFDEFQEALLRDPADKLLVALEEWQYGDAGKLPRKDRPRLYALDPSHPKVLAFIREVFETYRRWGVRYYMIDFLAVGAGNIYGYPYRSHFDAARVAGPEVYTRFLRLIRETVGGDTYILSSTGPTFHNAGLVDGVRVGNDLGEGRQLNPGYFLYPATFMINKLDMWSGPQEALFNQAANFHTHRRLYLNDSGNVLTVDKPIPLPHARINATIHAFSGGPTMLGDDIRTIGEDRLSLIKKTLPRSAAVGIPVDLFDAPYPDKPRLFHRIVERPWGRFDVLAVYNLESSPLKIAVDLAKLKLAAGRSYLAWDFWDEYYLGAIKGSLTLDVPPETVKVIRLTEHLNQPLILGTDMHVMMGEMEIGDFGYDPDSMVLRLTAVRPPRERGMVFVHAPDNVYIRDFDGLHIAKDGRDNSLIIGVPLTFDETGAASRRIQFGPLAEVLAKYGTER